MPSPRSPKLLRVPVPVRITAIVLLAILIPSVLITLLGLFAVFRAEPMVRERLAYPIEQSLDRLRDRLSQEWMHRFQEMGRRVEAGSAAAAGSAEGDPHLAGVLVYSGGTFRRPASGEPPRAFEASPADPELVRARELEHRRKDYPAALSAYRSAAAAGAPEAAAEALFGAARCHRELKEWQQAVRTLRQLVDRFGDTEDLTGTVRALPALLAMAEISRENGDLPGEGAAARDLAAELRRRRDAIDPEQAAFYLARLKRHQLPEEPGPSGPAAEPEAPPPRGERPPGRRPDPALDEGVLMKLRLHAEDHAPSAAPDYHWVARPDGSLLTFAFFQGPGGDPWYLLLDPAEYLRDARFFTGELGLSARSLRFTEASGRPVPGASLLVEPPPAAVGSAAGTADPHDLRPLATRALPRPFSHLRVDYHPAPGEVTVELRRLETSRVALFTWSIIVLVLLIILGVSLTLRSVLKEMRVTRLKSDFVSFVTHELKTPLTAIRMFAETLLLGRVAGEEERRRCLELIDQEAARLTRLIEQILEFSRIERRQKAFEFASADMAEVVDEAVRIFQEHNRESRCEIEVNKAQQRISRIKMDRAAMVELLLNLLSNALKYSRDSRKIVVNVRESINDISVEVIDRGIGIPKREHRKIFEQFYRAEDYLTREVEGTGLGLTFARYIAKVHGGDIRVQSAVNQGSTFTLELRKNQILAE